MSQENKKMTRVVQLQYSMQSGGAMGLKMQQFFLQRNIDSSIVSLKSDNTVSSGKIVSLGRKANIISWIDNKLQHYLTKKSIKKFGLFSYPVLGTDISKLEEIKNADYIYVHWVLKGFLNFRNIEQLARLNKPLIFIMHDMWNITGGCHHSFTCDKYTTGCSNCQVFEGNKNKDLAFREFEKKKRLYAKYKNLYFVSPSKWLYECAKQSALTKDKPVFYIPNIIDNTLFKPFDKNAAKEFLNISSDETVIAFGAVSIESPYKGWRYLQKALTALKQNNSNENITVIIFGSGYNKEVAENIPFKVKFMGFLADPYSTILVYNAADVFIVPSLADNLPTTVLESLCCGTPVVGFETGGIPDMIDHKKNGYIAKYKDADDLAAGILFCLQYHLKGYILPSFEPSLIVSDHLALFEQIKSIQS